MFLNGTNYNQTEPVLDDVLLLDFGIDNTRCRRMILTALEHVGNMGV
jgi:DNA-directed RNA polymerase subunit N (RpoN/RPB10)